ncbi:MAG: hypothetical protein DMG79_14495 [Acidobacteria bacterium]|nr:MAG: hypothetical protein DMG79_14495 [Acidobacteriota bacterium]
MHPEAVARLQIGDLRYGKSHNGALDPNVNLGADEIEGRGIASGFNEELMKRIALPRVTGIDTLKMTCSSFETIENWLRPVYTLSAGIEVRSRFLLAESALSHLPAPCRAKESILNE